jgi:PEP-CTERM motif
LGLLDATANAARGQINYYDVPLTTVSGNLSESGASEPPVGGPATATVSATVSPGSTSATGSASSTGGGGASFAAETSFMDTLTRSPGTWDLGYVPVGDSVSVNGGTGTAGTAFTTMSADISALSAVGGAANILQNVCAEEENGASVSCGEEWQASPTALVSKPFVVTEAGTYQITAYMLGEAVVNGGAIYYPCGASACYDLYTVTGAMDYGDPHFYLLSLTPGATYTSASGLSYTPPSSVPEPSSWSLLGLAVFSVVTLRRRRTGSAQAA